MTSPSEEEEALTASLFGGASAPGRFSEGVDEGGKKGKGRGSKASKGKKGGGRYGSKESPIETDSEDDLYEHDEASVGISIDRSGSSSSSSLQVSKGGGASRDAVWSDKDDETLQVNLNATDRLKKLKPVVDAKKGDKSDAKVSGLELSNLLHER